MSAMQSLLGLQALPGDGSDRLVVVEQDGSPHGPSKFVLWNPPLSQQGGMMYDGEDGRFKHMTRTEAKFKAGQSKYAHA